MPGCIRQCLTGQSGQWRAAPVVYALTAKKGRVSLMHLLSNQFDYNKIFLILLAKTKNQETQVPPAKNPRSPPATWSPQTHHCPAKTPRIAHNIMILQSNRAVLYYRSMKSK